MTNTEIILNNKKKLLKMYFIECIQKNKLEKTSWNISRLNLLTENIFNTIKENIPSDENFNNNFFLKEDINLSNVLNNLHNNYSNGIKSDIVKDKMIDQIMMEGEMNKKDIDDSINNIITEGFVRYILSAGTPQIKNIISENIEFNHIINKIQFI
jgi:hypothetical protein